MWKLSELPEITFATADVDEMESEALVILEAIMKRKLARGDPLRLFTKALLSVIAQQNIKIDTIAKQNLLYYAKGDNLDHIGAFVGSRRLQPTAATCKVEVEISAVRDKPTVIKKGTRITSGDKVYFALDSDVIFLAGETIREAHATCTEVGTVGNDYVSGEVKDIVDPQPYLQSIRNITKTEGGSDVEDNESFRERIHEAPESFSIAGPEGAYIYLAKSASALISDVKAISPDDGVVAVYVLLEGGQLPGEEIINLVKAKLSPKDKRPLTDKVEVKKPEVTEYEIEVRYLISKENATMAAFIQEAAEMALQEYIEWQRSKLGRDINDTELNYRMRKAGVKRLEIIEPKFKQLTEVQVAIPKTIKVIYGGLEEE